MQLWILALVNIIFWSVGFVLLYKTIGRQQQLESRLASLEQAVQQDDSPEVSV